jgi:hypothetical protein
MVQEIIIVFLKLSKETVLTNLMPCARMQDVLKPASLLFFNSYHLNTVTPTHLENIRVKHTSVLDIEEFNDMGKL